MSTITIRPNFGIRPFKLGEHLRKPSFIVTTENIEGRINLINIEINGEPVNSIIGFDKYGDSSLEYIFQGTIFTDSTIRAVLVIGDTKIYSNEINVTFSSVFLGSVKQGERFTLAEEVCTQKQDSFTKNYTLDGERFCFAYPLKWGKLHSVMDNNGYDIKPDFTERKEHRMLPNDIFQVYYVYTYKHDVHISDFNVTYNFFKEV